MLDLFRRSLSARIYVSATVCIAVLSVAMYLLSVPYIQTTVEGVEERYARTVLDDVYLMVEQINREIANNRQNILQERKNGLVNIISVIESHADWLDSKVRDGSMTRARAREILLQDIRHLQYGKNDYIFAADYHSVLVSHPDPILNGADFSAVRDSRGNLVIPPMVEGAKANGKGFYSYWWRRLGDDRQSEKLTYYSNLPAFEIIVATGLYLDDVEDVLSKMRETAIRGLRLRLNGNCSPPPAFMAA